MSIYPHVTHALSFLGIPFAKNFYGDTMEFLFDRNFNFFRKLFRPQKQDGVYRISHPEIKLRKIGDSWVISFPRNLLTSREDKRIRDWYLGIPDFN